MLSLSPKQNKFYQYSLPEFLILLRKRGNYTQQELASALGLKNRRSIHNWEAGESLPKAEHLIKLVEFYFGHRVFLPAEEEAEIRLLWKLTKNAFDNTTSKFVDYPVLDELWLKKLLTFEKPARIIQGGLHDIPHAGANSNLNQNLPHYPTSFIDRVNELQTLTELIAANQLVTITGPGGVGKTRLSVELARKIAGKFKDGLFYFSLAEINDAETLLVTLAEGLGMVGKTGGSLADRLVEHLTGKECLLVLDNFEQLASATGLIGQFLYHLPKLKMLVTSRQILNLYGEQKYLLSPLAFPDDRLVGAEFARYPAVELFVERAKVENPAFYLEDDNKTTVFEICRCLDGLPLAIELAAARSRVLSLPVLLEKLQMQGFGILETERPNIPPRHQTLHDTIQWSYALLTEPEKTLFRRLGVFTGRWNLDDIENICNDFELPLNRLTDLLFNLVDKSLVMFNSNSREIGGQYYLLQTIREFSRQK